MMLVTRDIKVVSVKVNTRGFITLMENLKNYYIIPSPAEPGYAEPLQTV